MSKIYLVQEYKNKEREILGMNGTTFFMNCEHYCFQDENTKLYVVMTRGSEQVIRGEFERLSKAIELLEFLG